ncbi:expressed unknown protein [Seminavis robusta]|uniref:Uncharacterized protein n=1 Tax=Seminavis robusta TaxID=568900 RepID=A0A9N8EZJ6_9STRA|nr:expressed unknown protein [Seminavis robusta]|eukprot:Sro2691_g334760.1 n/a (264) ;mRNA; r:1203-1994
MKLVVHKPNNGGFESSTATDVTIWGGNLWNCGEHSASKLVQSRRKHLQRFIYLPEAHKGGRMVRPHYYRGDRGATMDFPSLQVLGYYEDLGTPADVKWIVPNLKTLLVFCGVHRAWLGDYVDRWSVQPANPPPPRRRQFRNLLQRIQEQCPDLEEVLVCAAPDYDVPEKIEVVRKLTPARPAPWECLRLLEVAVRKPQAGDLCFISQMPEAVMDLIVGYFHAPKWKQEDFAVDKDEEDEEEDGGDDVVGATEDPIGVDLDSLE